MEWYGAIEAGGTKFLCAVADNQGCWLDQTRIETSDPKTTLSQVCRFFEPHLQRQPAAGLGIASFGPLDLDPDSASYGHITTTPKPGWSHTNLLHPLQQLFGITAHIDTDVNAAALAEARWGAGRGCDPLVYITVGTGVGGGLVVHGRPVHGLVHPEIGHMRVPRVAGDDFPGICPYHNDCIEGLCCGPAIAARCGLSADQLPADDPLWPLTARYLAQMAVNLILTLSPQKLIFGGGVMDHAPLLDHLRREAYTLLNHYLAHPRIDNNLESLISAPELAPASGLWGALALAMGDHPNTATVTVTTETEAEAGAQP